MHRPRKHSLTLHGHRTSVSLEDPFWECLLRLARDEGISVNQLAARIDAARSSDEGLASAIRVWCLLRLQERLDPAWRAADEA